MKPIARLPLTFALVGLLTACAGAPNESSSASAISTVPITSAAVSPTAMPSAEPASSESAALLPSGEPNASRAVEDATVQIVGFAFAPAELTLKAGSKVTFTNLDAFSHTATAGSGDEPMPEIFDSGRLAEGDSFSLGFDDAGTYDYYCAVHPAMEASITVED